MKHKNRRDRHVIGITGGKVGAKCGQSQGIPAERRRDSSCQQVKIHDRKTQREKQTRLL
jgi:hypothetical protein